MTQSLAARLKDETRAVHEQAESQDFVTNLVEGHLSQADYRELLVQSWFLYRALERAGERLADDPLAGVFVDEALLRLAALERDLDHLFGEPGWRAAVTPLAATSAYVDRLETVAAKDPLAFVAHHYTRYLGDLSGGQIMRRKLQEHLGLTHEGLEFYDFPLIPKTKPYKDAYRAKLDALDVDEDGAQRVVAEAIVAFGLNQALFVDLDAHVGGHPATR